VILIIRPLWGTYGDLLENQRLPYYFLYFGTSIFLCQNIALFIFHGAIAASYSPFSRYVEIQYSLLSAFPYIYHILMVLDLVAAGCVLLYFWYIHPTQTKTRFRTYGIMSTLGFITSSILWRFGTGFYTTIDFQTWLSNDFHGDMQLVFITGQFFEAGLWYCYYRLTHVHLKINSKYLDNQVMSQSSIPQLSLIVALLFATSGILFILSLPIGIGPPYGVIISITLAIKTLVLPVSSILLDMKIFQKFNLVF